MSTVDTNSNLASPVQGGGQDQSQNPGDTIDLWDKKQIKSLKDDVVGTTEGAERIQPPPNYRNSVMKVQVWYRIDRDEQEKQWIAWHKLSKEIRKDFLKKVLSPVPTMSLSKYPKWYPPKNPSVSRSGGRRGRTVAPATSTQQSSSSQTELQMRPVHGLLGNESDTIDLIGDKKDRTQPVRATKKGQKNDANVQNKRFKLMMKAAQFAQRTT